MITSIKNKIKLALKSLGLIFLLLYSPTIIVFLLNINVSKLSDLSYIGLIFISNIIFLGFIIYIYRDTLKKDFKSFFKYFEDNINTSLKYWLIGLGIMIFSNLFITYIINKPLAGNEEQVRSMINIAPILMIIDTAFYAPIAEELVFRKSIKDIIKNKWLYAIVSGLIFGGLHIISYINGFSDLLYLIPYSALGVSFALLYHKTDNIFSSISMHMLHNSISVLIYLVGGLRWKNF